MQKKLGNIILVLAAFIVAFFTRNGKKKINPKRFVVIQPTNNLGDMVCVTPIFRAIKARWPEAYIAVVGSVKNRELLAHSQDVDEYIVMPSSFFMLIRKIRLGKFDTGIAVNFDPAHPSIFILGGVSAISSFRLTSPFRRMEPRLLKWISALIHVTEYVPGQYIPDQYLKLLVPFGIVDSQAKKFLSFSGQNLERVLEARSSAGIPRESDSIAIAPGAGSDLKRWPADRFVILANRLYEKFKVPLVLIGGPKDQDAVKEVIEGLTKDVIYWNPGPQPIDELKVTLSRASLVIGNDSGAVHIGEAVGAKTVTIAGATDVEEHMAEDEMHRVIKGKSEGSRYRSYIVNELDMDIDLARKQMEAVTVDDVYNEVVELIK